MRPDQLTAEHFRRWPPGAREVAVTHLAVLRTLPLGLVALLFRELIEYDWKFPAERSELDRQLRYLAGTPHTPDAALGRFAQLRLTSELERMDWVNSPAQFSEMLSAHLWATHQIDAFRSAAVEYVKHFNASIPEEPPPASRIAVVCIGQGVAATTYRPFRKLKRQGTYFKAVTFQRGVPLLVAATAARASAHPMPYGHWYIDGAANEDPAPAGLTSLSYSGLEPVRTAIAAKMRSGYDSGIGPETVRAMLTATHPEQLRLSGDPIWSRFALNLFTEGSGTQIFSTTFVQWAAREALRRAQPLTLLARFGPRAREQSMEQLLTPGRQALAQDPEGSLVDGDMGAWYTWLNMQRLTASDKSSFLAWFEGHGEAVAIGPSFAAGTVSETAISLAELMERIGLG